MVVVLNRRDLEAIGAHARKTYPEECCGILGGRIVGEQLAVPALTEGPNGRGPAEGGEGPIRPATGGASSSPTESSPCGSGPEMRVVERILPIDNAREESKQTRYLISPLDYLKAERELRAAGLDVLGFYHSHPDHPARPSGFDLEHAWPWYVYVIVSVVNGREDEVTGWMLEEDRHGFEPVPIEIRETPTTEEG